MKNHSIIRKVLLGVSTPVLLIPTLILFLWGIFVFFLPGFPQDLVQGFALSMVILWMVILGSTFFLGRSYCSHICPITGLFSSAAFLTKNRELLSMEYPSFFGIIFPLVWISGPVYTALRIAGNLLGFLPYQGIYQHWSVILISLLFLGSLILSRTYGKTQVPHYICPFSPYTQSAMNLSKLLRVPGLELKIQEENCKSCKTCRVQAHCLMNMDLGKKIPDKQLDFSQCLNCGSCAEQCKFHAVAYRWGNQGEG